MRVLLDWPYCSAVLYSNVVWNNRVASTGAVFTVVSEGNDAGSCCLWLYQIAGAVFHATSMIMLLAQSSRDRYWLGHVGQTPSICNGHDLQLLAGSCPGSCYHQYLRGLASLGVFSKGAVRCLPNCQVFHIIQPTELSNNRLFGGRFVTVHTFTADRSYSPNYCIRESQQKSK